MKSIPQKRVFKLNLNENEIEELIIENHLGLKLVEARKNKIVDKVSFKGSSNLKEIYLAENQITSMNFVEDIKGFVEKLHLRANKIEKITEKRDL